MRERRKGSEHGPAWLCCALVAIATLTGSTAAAATERVYVLDLADNGVGEQAAKQLTTMLRKELSPFLGRRLLRPAQVAGVLATPAVAEQVRCDSEDYVACAVAVGQAVRADLVITGAVASLGDAQMVDLRLVDTRARSELNRLQSPLTDDKQENRRVLRDIGVRLAAPEAYTGTLLVNEVRGGDRIIVDGAEVAVTVPTSRLPLPVAQHTLEVVRAGNSALTQIIEIRFDETFAVSVPGLDESGATAQGDQVAGHGAGDTGGSATTFPVWPAWAAVGVTALSLVGGTVFMVDYFTFAADNLAQRQQELEDAQNSDPPVSCPGDAETLSCFEDPVEYAQTMRTLDIVGTVGLGVVAAAAAGAAIYLFVLAGDEESEAIDSGATESW